MYEKDNNLFKCVACSSYNPLKYLNTVDKICYESCPINFNQDSNAMTCIACNSYEPEITI